MLTSRELRRQVEDIHDSLLNTYGHQPFCEYLHQELGMGQTPLPDEQLESRREMLADVGYPVPEGSVKLTVEHDDLHLALRRMVMDIRTQGGDDAQLAAAMLIVGRRIGMAEAAGALAGFDPDTEVPE